MLLPAGVVKVASIGTSSGGSPPVAASNVISWREFTGTRARPVAPASSALEIVVRATFVVPLQAAPKTTPSARTPSTSGDRMRLDEAMHAPAVARAHGAGAETSVAAATNEVMTSLIAQSLCPARPKT